MTQPRKVGRPTKRSPEIEGKILAILRAGVPLSAAARSVGVCKDTLEDWRKADEDFSAACEEAMGSAEASMTVRLIKQAEEGNVAAAIYWLKCRCPEMREPKERPERIDLGVPISGVDGLRRMILAIAQQVADGVVPISALRDAADAADKASGVIERSDLENRIKALEESTR